MSSLHPFSRGDPARPHEPGVEGFEGSEPVRHPPEAASGGSESSGGYGAELRRSMAAAAERIDEIMETAERIAEKIRRDAELEAERYLAERRHEADLESEEQRARARRAFDTLRLELAEIERRTLDSLESASSPRRADAGEAAPPAAPGLSEFRSGRQSAPASAAAPGPAQPAEPRATEVKPAGQADAATALVRATQLAVIGKSRAEIESALRNELGVERPDEIIDQILPR